MEARMRATCARLITSTLVGLAVVALEAGGWVVITITDVPDHVVAGKPVTFTYGVRQHGRHLLQRLAGSIEARAGSEVVRAVAAETSDPGHYSATLTLPHAGEWTVDILSGFSGSLNAARVALLAIDEGQSAPVLTETERGRRLFAAKGCITCHAHRAVLGRSTSAGATLTARRYAPAYLANFLARPPQIEPYVAGEWQMPDLKLRDSEIAALVAFLNADTTGTSSR
jgi:mono/diheme cytochrome c family protein